MAKVLRLSDERAGWRVRQKRWRERIKQNRASYVCDIGPEMLQILIVGKYITQEEADGNNKRRIGEAITLFLADAVEKLNSASRREV